MRYVPQQDSVGCLIAAVAMVLDMSYEQVSGIVPIQDMGELQRTGTNRVGLLALDRIKKLAESQGKQVIDLPEPFVCKAGTRYVSAIATTDPLMAHTVAVDENGVVFDPLNEHTRKDWSGYQFLAMLELRSL
jgi:hypothetical protein